MEPYFSACVLCTQTKSFSFGVWSNFQKVLEAFCICVCMCVWRKSLSDSLPIYKQNANQIWHEIYHVKNHTDKILFSMKKVVWIFLLKWEKSQWYRAKSFRLYLKWDSKMYLNEILNKNQRLSNDSRLYSVLNFIELVLIKLQKSKFVHDIFCIDKLITFWFVHAINKPSKLLINNDTDTNIVENFRQQPSIKVFEERNLIKRSH